MKKITYYKNMTEYDKQQGGYYVGKGKNRLGYHFEQAQGYLFGCPNGIKIAVEKNNFGYWVATELTSGYSVTHQCNTRTEAIGNACSIAVVVKKLLDNPNEQLTIAIKALKTYIEQKQRLVA